MIVGIGITLITVGKMIRSNRLTVYTDPASNLTLDEIIQDCVYEKPGYFKQVGAYSVGENRSTNKVKEWIRHFPLLNKMDLLRAESATVKNCYGLNELFKQSYIVRFPFDFALKVSHTGQYLYKAATPVDCDSFSVEQMGLTDHLHLKLQYSRVKFCTDRATSMIFSNNVYYRPQPFEIMPGLVTYNSNFGMDLIVNMLFPKRDSEYFFPKGDPWYLATVLTDKKPKLYHCVGTVPTLDRKTFINSFGAELAKTKIS